MHPFKAKNGSTRSESQLEVRDAWVNEVLRKRVNLHFLLSSHPTPRMLTIAVLALLCVSASANASK